MNNQLSCSIKFYGGTIRGDMDSIYLDHSATTPMDPRVFEAMQPYYTEEFGNAASIHSFGQKARLAVEDARAQVAELIGSKTNEIFFTSGGTESDNTALRGVATGNRSKGNHIITTTIEHSAVLKTCRQLEKEGFQVSYIPTDDQGLVKLNRLRKEIKAETILISVMHGNNEIGVIEPIEEISALAKKQGIYFHTDAVQTTGKILLDVQKLGVDLLSLSAHKFHGPKGMGALYVRPNVRMDPLVYGGTHERNRRAGTLNVAGIVGLGKACALAKMATDELNTRVRSLRDRLEKGILEKIEETSVNGSTIHRLPHLSNISFRHLEGEALLIALDFHGVAVSTGSACSSGVVEPSHVLIAIGTPPSLRNSAIRFSLSRMNTKEDISCLLQILPPIVERIRKASPLYRTS